MRGNVLSLLVGDMQLMATLHRDPTVIQVAVALSMFRHRARQNDADAEAAVISAVEDALKVMDRGNVEEIVDHLSELFSADRAHGKPAN